jgi:hypothetical protein
VGKDQRDRGTLLEPLADPEPGRLVAGHECPSQAEASGGACREIAYAFSPLPCLGPLLREEQYQESVICVPCHVGSPLYSGLLFCRSAVSPSSKSQAAGDARRRWLAASPACTSNRNLQHDDWLPH